LDSDISPAKAWFDKLTTLSKFEGQRRQVRRGKIFLTNDFHVFCGLCAFAGDIPSFGCGCSPTGEPRSLGKSVRRY